MCITEGRTSTVEKKTTCTKGSQHILRGGGASADGRCNGSIGDAAKGLFTGLRARITKEENWHGRLSAGSLVTLLIWRDTQRQHTAKRARFREGREGKSRVVWLGKKREEGGTSKTTLPEVM